MFSSTPSAAQEDNKTTTMAEKYTVLANNDAIVKSAIDNREYRIIELSNGLKVMLVSDKDADKAAVSLDVSVGSGSDPLDAQGLAHFLEHMLFLGNEKYPEPGEYQEFIQQHGGGTNAFTAYDQTNYFFDINVDYLEPAIDRFSQFFISPLFSQEYAERERNIVDSEYNARRTNEYRRIFSARKELFNPAHPITKFSIGNNETLADNLGASEGNAKAVPIQDKLVNFYNDYYSASIMALTIIGNQSIDELSDLAVKYFTAINNNNYQVALLDTPLYNEGTLPKLLYVKPLKEQSSLNLSFAIPEVESFYKVKPTFFLSNLFGHEGEGSLLSYLKEQGWALNLSAGLELSHKEEASFAISVNLTDKGMQNWQQVVEAFYLYVGMIESMQTNNIAGAQKIYDEQSQITALDFNYQRRSDNADYAVSISHQLKQYPAEEVLSAPALMDNFDADVISRYLSYIRVDNMLAILVDKELATNQSTQYYDADYQINDFDAAYLAKLEAISYVAESSPFSLPIDNKFIAEDTTMVSDVSQSLTSGILPVPELVMDDKGFQFWYQTDVSFESPRANFYISLRNPLIGQDAKTQVLNQLYTRVVSEKLNEYLYPAYLADLNVSIYPHLRGISIRIGGFNDKQNLLLSPVFETLFNESIDAKLFADKKEEIIRQYNDSAFEMPYQKLYGHGNDLFLKNSWPISEKLKVVKDITVEDLEAFRIAFTQSLDVVALNYGNVDKSTAESNAKLMREALPSAVTLTKVAHSQVANLDKVKQYVNALEVAHEDSAVMVVAQSQLESIDEKAKMYLLYQLIDSAFYHELRTVQQLGYIVSSNPYSSLEFTGMGLIVESSAKSAVEIYQAIDDFIATIGEQVAKVEDEQFASMKKGLISKISKRDDNLEERTNRIWHELDRENFNFDTKEQLIKAVNALDKASMQAFAAAVFGKDYNPQDYARLVLVTKHKGDDEVALIESLQAVSKDSLDASDWQVITDIAEFKANVDYHQ